MPVDCRGRKGGELGKQVFSTGVLSRKSKEEFSFFPDQCLALWEERTVLEGALSTREVME